MEHENIRIVPPSLRLLDFIQRLVLLECQREKLRNFLVKFITIRLVTDFQKFRQRIVKQRIQQLVADNPAYIKSCRSDQRCLKPSLSNRSDQLIHKIRKQQGICAHHDRLRNAQHIDQDKPQRRCMERHREHDAHGMEKASFFHRYHLLCVSYISQ